MNIVVLAGGLSPERDVSLSSGAKICQALRQAGHRAMLVDLYYGVETLHRPLAAFFSSGKELEAQSIRGIAPDLDAVRASRGEGFSARIGKNVLELCQAADITFLALHGGDGENGRVQAFFDLSDVKYTGSGYFGCAVAMEKWTSKRLIRGAGVATPDAILLKETELRDLDNIRLPVVVKPCSGGSSIGVSIVRSPDELANALCEAFKYEDQVLLETYVQGRELSCGVLGGTALPVIEIIPKQGFYDYANKYQPGCTEEIVPARIDTGDALRIQSAAEEVFRALHLSVYARVDFILCPDGKLWCLEANTLPGMTPMSLLPQEAAAAGIEYTELCHRIVTLSLEKYKESRL